MVGAPKLLKNPTSGGDKGGNVLSLCYILVMTTPETAVHVATSEAEFCRAIDIVYQRIAVAAQRVDRAPEDIRLLPGSKTVTEDRMRAAYAAGLRQLGEHKVQEAQTKAEAMGDLYVHCAVNGALQSIQARDVVQFAAEFEALDRLRIARRLDNPMQRFGRSLEVYVQVSASGDHTKSGLLPDDVEDFLGRL